MDFPFWWCIDMIRVVAIFTSRIQKNRVTFDPVFYKMYYSVYLPVSTSAGTHTGEPARFLAFPDNSFDLVFRVIHFFTQFTDRYGRILPDHFQNLFVFRLIVLFIQAEIPHSHLSYPRFMLLIVSIYIALPQI